MAKYVKNPGGGIHSVPDDFEAPAEWGEDDFEVTEAEAREAAPNLFGADDPEVLRHRLSDERAADPADPGVPAPDAPAAPEPEEGVAA